MKVLGITGQVGAGKSTILAYLEEKYRAKVIQADQVGHLVMEPDTSCYKQICSLFGEQILAADQKIDRKKLGAIVFACLLYTSPSLRDPKTSRMPSSA